MKRTIGGKPTYENFLRSRYPSQLIPPKSTNIEVANQQVTNQQLRNQQATSNIDALTKPIQFATNNAA